MRLQQLLTVTRTERQSEARSGVGRKKVLARLLFFLLVEISGAIFGQHAMCAEAPTRLQQTESERSLDAAISRAVREEERAAQRERSAIDPTLVQIMVRLEEVGADGRTEISKSVDKYAEENPRSPFLPELYYHAGSLFGPARGEGTLDRERMESYFRLAQRGFAQRYSVFSLSVDSHLANGVAGHEARADYYQRLLDLQSEAIPLSLIYPIRNLRSAIKGSLSPEYTNEEIDSVIVNLRESLETRIPSAESWILRSASLKEQQDLLQRFPGGSLARKIRIDRDQRLDSILGKVFQETIGSLESSPTVESSVVEAELSEASSAEPGTASERGVDSLRGEPEARQSRLPIMTGTLCAVAIVFLLIRSKIIRK